MSWFGVSVYARCSHRPKITFCLLHFMKANDLVGCHVFFYLYQNPVSHKQQITILYNEHTAVPVENPHFRTTHNYLPQTKWMFLLLKAEDVTVRRGSRSARLFCAMPVCCRRAWRGCHTNLAVARQPCLETRWYGLEIMSVKERVKRCTHAQIFCTLKRRLGLAERSCYSIRTWTSANGRREELEIMHVGTQLSVCAPLHYLWSLLISCQNTADDIWLPACLREGVFLCNDFIAATLLLPCLK